MELRELIDLLCVHAQPLLNSIGIGLDIVGAFLVATEVVNQFEGQKYQVLGPGPVTTAEGRSIIDPVAEDTKEFKSWEHQKISRMKVGLALLTLGFVIQIMSNWVRYPSVGVILAAVATLPLAWLLLRRK